MYFTCKTAFFFAVIEHIHIYICYLKRLRRDSFYIHKKVQQNIFHNLLLKRSYNVWLTSLSGLDMYFILSIKFIFLLLQRIYSRVILHENNWILTQDQVNFKIFFKTLNSNRCYKVEFLNLLMLQVFAFIQVKKKKEEKKQLKMRVYIQYIGYLREILTCYKKFVDNYNFQKPKKKNLSKYLVRVIDYLSCLASIL